MARKQRSALLPNNIILLQNLVKRDPASYREEFLQQYAHYESLRDILMESSSTIKENGIDEQLKDLIGFITAVCGCYTKETASFPEELKSLITNHHRDLNPELREKIIQCLVMLRNKNIITPESLIQTIFPLLSEYSSANNTTETNSKALRKQIFNTLVTLLRSLNSGTVAARLNKMVQNLFLSGLNKENALFVTKITIKLWYSKIWTDSRTVEIMVQSTLNGDLKVAIAGARFFLGVDKDFYDNEEEDEDEVDMSQIKHNLKINKKTKKQSKKLDSAVKTMKRRQNKDPNKNVALNFSAIQLLRDPQGFAESLFKHLTSNKKLSIENKIILMNLISRIVGINKLQVLGLYSYFLKYLTPKQTDVTKILAACAQSSHDLVPPDAINMMVKKIADEFVSDGVSTEACSAGINSIREILTRAPLAIDQDLLHDLTEYHKSKAKGVNIAAKSLISLYREVAPDMLHRKDRGKEASMMLQAKKAKTLKFGEENTIRGIPGIELLDKWREEQGLAADEDNDDDWNVPEEEEDLGAEIDGEWVTVESDKEYEVNTDDSDEEPETQEEPENEEENGDSDSDLDLSDDESSKSKKNTKSNKNKPISKKAKKRRRELQEEEDRKLNGDSEQSFKKLATSRILTPADFEKLEELKMKAGVEKIMGVTRKTLTNEEEVNSDRLVGPVKRKQTKEERIESIKEGREDREKFGSRRGKIETPHSTTNREKARKKNFIMMIHKRQVSGKARRSLRDKQRVLRAHIERKKKAL